MTLNRYSWNVGRSLPILKPHSQAKHRIFEKYLRRYIEICTARTQQESFRLTIVDGYAGGGSYMFNNEKVRGSPLIALDTIHDMQKHLSEKRDKGFTLHTDFIFNDINKNNTEYLRSEIESSEYKSRLGKTIHIWTDDFNNRVDDMITIAKKRSPKKGRAIFFLDQYGWSTVTFQSIKNILEKLEKAEIFLTFSVDALVNFITESKFDETNFRNIEISKEFYSELVRDKQENSHWRTFIQNKLYKHIVESTNAKYYSTFFVRSLDSNRSYWLIHLSQHREARNEIGNIHWQVSNISLHHGDPGLNPLGFSTHQDFRQRSFGYNFDEDARKDSMRTLEQQIPRLIHEEVNENCELSFEQLFGRRCNDTPVTRQIMTEVLLKLRAESEIELTDNEGKLKDRANNIGWDDRIVLPKQRTFFIFNSHIT